MHVDMNRMASFKKNISTIYSIRRIEYIVLLVYMSRTRTALTIT